MCLNSGGRMITAKLQTLKLYFIGENDKGENDRGYYCNLLEKKLIYKLLDVFVIGFFIIIN